MDKVEEGSLLYPVKGVAKDHILNYWTTRVNRSAVIMSALLSFDSDYRDHFDGPEIDKAQEWFVEDFGVEFLHFYSASSGRDRADTTALLADQWAAFKRSLPPFERFQDYVRLFTMHNQRLNPVKVWDKVENSAPELCSIVFALLSIPASEACVERSFSAQDAVHTKKRNRLKDKRVQAEMFIKVNERALKAKKKPSEMTADYEDLECTQLTEDYSHLELLQTTELTKKRSAWTRIEPEPAAAPADVAEEREENALMEDAAPPSPVANEEEEEEEEEEDEMDAKYEPSRVEQKEENQQLSESEREKRRDTEFLLRYIRANNVTVVWKFNQDKKNALEALAMQEKPPIKTAVGDLIVRIKELLKEERTLPPSSSFPVSE
jgi:hypothetical protein